MVQQPLNFNYPLPYIQEIPDNSSVGSEGSHFHVGPGGVVARFVNPDVTGTRVGTASAEFVGNLQLGDPFPSGAVAQFPNGSFYIKAGNAWLPMPTRDTVPIVLVEQVHGYEEYWVIEQTPYSGSRPVNKPRIVPFNVSLLSARDGSFSGADEPAFGVQGTASGKPEGKISIAVDIPLMTPWSQSLQSSSQVNAAVTKGHLAKGVVREIEKALDLSSKFLVAFFNKVLIKEVSMQDLFLVDLVQRSKGTFQPTIALRVPPVH